VGANGMQITAMHFEYIVIQIGAKILF